VSSLCLCLRCVWCCVCVCVCDRVVFVFVFVLSLCHVVFVLSVVCCVVLWCVLRVVLWLYRALCVMLRVECSGMC
jgi:hypothetical protein